MPSDLLILDEPTNHLDVAAREWLEMHLQSRNTACVLSSHDRMLLSKFATRIVEIERGRVTVFEGGYEEYREARSLLDRHAWQAYDAFERRRVAVEGAAERREHLARRVAMAPEGARGSKDFYRRKAAKVARTGRILRERVSEDHRVEKPWEEQPIDGLSFERVQWSGDVVVSAQGLAKAYGQRILFRNLSFVVRRGERLVIRGSNGSGKTTLLNIIQGKEQPDSGSVRLGEKTQLASLDQAPAGLELERSPLQICGTETQARTLLACLKLPADRLNRPLVELSGGERTKVALARILNSSANLLLLDEPTNHLEIEAQEALEQALQRYPGTLIAVSHDRSFVQAIGDEAIYLDLDAC
jgi:ATPase subunit of ABC transporter with duplicated ATPase domains